MRVEMSNVDSCFHNVSLATLACWELSTADHTIEFAVLLRVRMEGIMPLNMRQEPRNTIHQRAWISVGDGLPLQNCTVIDISGSGAKLALADDDAISHEFSLRLSGSGHPCYSCRVVWRRQNTIGVRFVSD
jgi:hypothetical protein